MLGGPWRTYKQFPKLQFGAGVTIHRLSVLRQEGAGVKTEVKDGVAMARKLLSFSRHASSF